MNIQQVIDDINTDVRSRLSQFEGAVASYIPALAEVDSEQFAMAVHTVDGQTFSTGDVDVPFTIQSVSKVLTLTLALQRYGNSLWHRVGKEPSGTAFNSLTQLEFEQGIPRNPFINAGAIVTCDALYSRLSAPTHHMLETVRWLSGNPRVCINQTVSRSEFQHRHRNAAMAHLMTSFGNFENDVEEVLKVYFGFCAIEMNCQELARTFGYLANRGVDIASGERILTSKQNSQLNSLLFTSGLYDAAGDFAYRVGMPGKSGVGGAIVAVVPGQFAVSVWSPKLNAFGNSSAGLYALEQFADRLSLHLF
ncbi:MULTISPECIES: glutaminase B [Pseudoalteromonas]|uniref:glutaminase B n=1 Tax=Pseudoalteromonas TaxID=53246 RepID=UPI000348036F|nr:MULTISPECIES: glutaminase B [Pseudoalteromonas]MCG7566062.1 glutaminase B [Pseudoalteromonas sp. CnMc7-15]MCG7569648.1 glutaminase B [Pseudoalteromonas sp. CNC9-20]QFU07002.1 Glutaminase 2 [Pseudoalteromonas sp. THAF3]TLX50384.1 glutaminase [Pseudoalteromonas ruthenica]TMO90375.1 glutaminase [Pseudoalteromonas ruthenica]